ncbi:MAG: methyltransferase domain-containing protein [Candidatus Lokiarchaeota archaeon]|nr:methyltransferase domain-containing protein [Candidatus Lokiarchaeota archaeon]
MDEENHSEDTLFGRIRSTVGRFFGNGVCPYEFSFTLMNPFRRFILSPSELLDRLQLAKDFCVLELGPGPGYFSPEVAKALTEGHLLLVDIQKEMLERNRKRLQKQSIANAASIHGDGCSLPIGSDTCDVAFLVAVLGEVPQPRLCIREMGRVLRNGGLLSITEQPGDPDHLSIDTVCNLVESEGFTVLESLGKDKNFTVNFRLTSI